MASINLQTGPSPQSQPPEEYETLHVHSIYQSIAPHFSSTRYKPWPRVSSFLSSLASGSVGLDIGCGNGKYLSTVNPFIYIIGSDRSSALIDIAAREKTRGVAGADVHVADGLALPHGRRRFDFVICVAVLHHLSTRERRREGVRACMEGLREGGTGKAMVVVWALEQGTSRRGWDVGCEQDVMVPWISKGKKDGGERVGSHGEKGTAEANEKTFQRYYHLYHQGELEEDILSVGGEVLESGYEKDNWWAVFCQNKKAD